MEFGQIPKQIFKVPHPRRLTGLPPMMTTGTCGCAASSEIGMCYLFVIFFMLQEL